jgi:hypothetical protein
LKTNPDDASYCYHDGRPLLKDLAQGPLPVGSLSFSTPFYFSDRQACTNFNQLALACDKNWEEARDLLIGGMWPPFFGSIGRFDLVRAAELAARDPDRDQALSQLLQKLPADPDFLRPPKLLLDFPEKDLGKLMPGRDHTFEVVIHNQGMLLLYGVVWSDCDWLTFGERSGRLCQKLFQTRNSYTLAVRVLGSKLRAGAKPLKGEIIIDTNGGRVIMPVQAAVPIQPFPEGKYANDSLAGALSPREIALKARAAPDAAAVLFQQGAVKAWYASNGWTYPIKGTGGMGKGAVQQFFEALGLAQPPRLEINTSSLQFHGAVGETLVQKVTISTEEAKPVYVEASSNENWVHVGQFKYLGNKVKVPLAVTVPPCPGKTVAARVTILGNGNQQFTVEVNVTVDNAPRHRPLAAPAPPEPRTGPTEPERPARNPMVRLGVLAGGGGLFLLLVFVGIVLILASQAGGPTEEHPIPGHPQGQGGNGNGPSAAGVKFATPEDVFAALKKSYAEGNFETYVNCLTEESQDALAGMFVLSAGLLKQAKKDQFAKHPLHLVFSQNKDAGVALDRVAESLKGFTSKQASGEDVKKLLRKLAEPITDKKSFLRATLNDVLADVLKPRTGLLGKEGVLKNVTVNGDQATAQIQHNEGSPQPMAFRKIAGDWFIDFPAAMFQPLRGLGNFHHAAIPPTELTLNNDDASVKGQLHFYDPVDPSQQQPCRVFKLQTTKGKYYVIQLQSGDFQPYLRIVDSAGKEHGRRDDQVPGCIRFEVPHTGHYRIVASTTNRTGDFALNVHREVQVELENWLDTTYGSWIIRRHGATGILVVQSASHQLIYLDWSASDHVKYRDADGNSYKLQAGGTKGPAPPFFLGTDDIRQGTPREKTLANGVYARGKWKLTVKGDGIEFQPAGDSDQGRLVLRRSADGFVYNGQEYRSPNLLTMNQVGQAQVSGNLQANDPLDSVGKQPCKVYHLQMTQGRIYVIDLASQGFNAYLRLEDSQGKELASAGAGTDARINFEALYTGKYRIIATMRNPSSGSYYLKAQVEEPMFIPPTADEGLPEFQENGARFGRWAIWVCPLDNPVKSAYVLIDRQSGQVIYVNWKSLSWMHCRNSGGKWYVLSKKANPAKDSPVSEAYLNLLKSRSQPTKKLTATKYHLSAWEFTVTDQQIVFRSSNREGTLIIYPYTEGFTFNGQTYGSEIAGASGKKD